MSKLPATGYAFTDNSCVDNTVESYLVDGVVPAKDVTCAGVPLPDPTTKSVSKTDQSQLMAQLRAVRHGLTV